MYKRIHWAVAVVTLLSILLAACQQAAPATQAPPAEKPKMSIVWFAWAPCQALTEQVKTYPDADVSVNCVPIAEWHNTIFTDFAAKGGADVVILDSQFIGEAVTGGHVVELTDWMKSNIEVDKFVPAAIAAYGEYPAGSSKYYGVAAEADTQMLVYRTDVFQEIGFEPAGTWTELLEQAQQIKEEKPLGVENGYVTFWCGAVACYDMVQTVWNQMAWSFGGELWDPATYKVDGILNSPENVAALEFAAELFKTGPDGAGNFQFGEVVSAICDGTTAMTTIWFGFGPAFIAPDGCKQSPNLAYALVPGEKEHFISLGGMGLSVSAYTKNKDAALALVKWFESEEQQLEWARLGGFTARTDVLASDTFAKAAPYNPAFAEAYQLVRDFWNLPEYNALLAVQGEQLNLAVTGQLDAQTALDTIAEAQQKILDEAYPDGPPK